VCAHASGDDIWPLVLNEFTTEEARTIAHEVPQMLDELLVAAGLDDQTPDTRLLPSEARRTRRHSGRRAELARHHVG
jgi:hypothetical protein